MQHGSGSTCLACAEDAALMGNASGAQDSQACPESHMFINSGQAAAKTDMHAFPVMRTFAGHVGP